MIKFQLRILILVFVAMALPVVAADPKPAGEDFMVPMRDGVKLATTVYLPEGDGPWPTVLLRTPYNKEQAKGITGGYLKNGYAIVGQDCRGRFKSEGDYVPFLNDREDGYDAVEWVAAQKWSNGKVGMWGGSALGITTYEAACAAPPHLVCGFAVVAPSTWRNEAMYIGGLYRKEMIDGWMKGQNADAVRIEWNKRPIADPYFDPMETVMKHADIKIPIYHVGGWYDIFLHGAIDNFTGIQSKGAEGAKGKQKLLMAAAGHGPFGSRFKQFPNKGGDIGKADAMKWFDYWLKGVDNGIMKEPAVTYFLMGDAEREGAPGNEWKTCDSWPPPYKEVGYYLHAGGNLSTDPPTEDESQSAYLYDPKNPAKTAGGGNLLYAKGPMDQREIGERPDYLRFNTEPLAEPLTITGPVKADLWVQTDAPDTDFMVKLVDVYPDGYEALILDSGLRLRYRKGIDKEVMMEPNKPEQIEIDLWSTALVFDKGHRIGVHVTSSNDPRFDPNPNTGKPFRSDDETRPANNAVHHSKTRVSGIRLPVAAESPAN